MSFTEKYPRIPHLPFSPGGTNDDKRLASVDHLLGKDIFITEKIDGSNLCMTHEDVFARSHGGPPYHKSFDLAKALHAQVKKNIPPSLSIFGEYIFAVHSIIYNSLPGYFLVFGVRDDEKKFWWSFNEAKEIANELGLYAVPILFRGLARKDSELQEMVEKYASGISTYGPEKEGVVVRISDGFSNNEFYNSMAKWVRADHPKDRDEHWMFKPIQRQGLNV